MLAKSARSHQDEFMANIEDRVQNPTDRIVTPIASSAVLECSQFCLANCGLAREAQEAVIAANMMLSGQSVSAVFDDDRVAIKIDDGSEPSQLKVTCEGPRKQYWIAGKLVCRKRVGIDIDPA